MTAGDVILAISKNVAMNGRDSTEVSVLTFDCYGTPIDWEAGIRDAL